VLACSCIHLVCITCIGLVRNAGIWPSQLGRSFLQLFDYFQLWIGWFGVFTSHYSSGSLLDNFM
jgi:hypothetical protein